MASQKQLPKVKPLPKRGRGRPARMDRLLYKIKECKLEGDELLTGAYSEAIQVIIDTMKDENAQPATRLQAAKTIKEYVEQTYIDYEQEDEEDNASQGSGKIQLSGL